LLNLAASGSHDRRMLELPVVFVRALALACRGHREVVLENLATGTGGA